MRHWFLSYNSQDLTLVEPLAGRLRSLADSEPFFAPASLRTGGFWLPVLAEKIHAADAFVLLVGEKGLGPWQILEYYEALDRRVKQPDFPVIVLLLEGQPAPGLPFLRQLHWIVEPDFAAETVIGKLQDAVAGKDSRPGELWRYTAPYRGLAAMTEADSDFFFGRTEETVAVLKQLAASSDCLPLLIGNSGVGKSSLAQAGILGALKRQAFPDGAQNPGPWPSRFQDSRRWLYLTLKPGTDPLRALVGPFLRTWQFDPLDPKREERRNEWITALLDGKATLAGLLDATEGRLEELGQTKPPAFLLYIDQGEELYVRSEERQRRRFSEILAAGLTDPRLFALMSMRADFLGALQNDAPLFKSRQQIDVPPLGEAELLEVVSRPAALLGARFESDGLATTIARRAAEKSVKDAGALPLLSYLLDDMWTQMVRRGDGVLRLEAEAVELGGVLATRADAFLETHPASVERLRHILTLKLATVREEGEPTRRRAIRSEFSEEEWRLVGELANHPHRLLVTATPDGREPYAEVAHEAIFRRWETLRKWVETEREFLIWKTGLEADRRAWEGAPATSRTDALLMGLALAHAQSWLAKRADDLPRPDREFVGQSLKRDLLERRQRERLRRLVVALSLIAFAVGITFGGFATWQRSEAQRQTAVAEQERARAEQNLAAAKRAVDALIFQIAQGLQDISGMRAETLQQILQTVETTIGNLVRSAPNDPDLQRSRGVMQMNFGDVYRRMGNMTRALAAYQQYLTISRDLTARDASNTLWQRDISISLNRIGDVRRDASDRAGALTAYEESLVIARRLAASDTGNTLWRRDVSVSLNKVGDVRRDASDRAGALTAYEEALVIIRRLATGDTGNTQLQRDLSFGLNRIGDVRRDASDRARALAAYEEALVIIRRLATGDTGNTQLQRDLSFGLNRIGDVRRDASDRAGALAAYEEGLVIIRRLAASDPGNTLWQRDLSVSLERTGDVRREAGDRAGAQTVYEEALAIRRRLAASDPGNTVWQRDVQLIEARLASVANTAP